MRTAHRFNWSPDAQAFLPDKPCTVTRDDLVELWAGGRYLVAVDASLLMPTTRSMEPVTFLMFLPFTKALS